MLFAGTEVNEFSPTDELAKPVEVVTRNLEADALWCSAGATLRP